MSNCDLYRPGAEGVVEIVTARKACRYHRRGQVYPLSRMTPDGLCPFAFHALYPDCLAMLSRGRYPTEGGREVCRIRCPFAGEGVEFGVFRIPRERTILGRLELLVRKAADRIVPVEILEHGIAIEVLRAGAGCPCGYRAGDRFVMNVKGKGEICPAAFYAIFPFSSSPARAGDRSGGLRVPCPDYITDIVFSLGGAAEPYFGRCDDYRGISLLVDGAGAPRDLNALLGEMGIPCLSVFATAFPYMLTLERGGSLGFLTRDRSAAGIQCPNPSARVRMFIRRDRADGRYRLEVHGRDAACPRGLEPGRSYALPPLEGGAFPLRALAALYPHIMSLKAGGEGGRRVRCATGEVDMLVEISRGEG